MKVYSVYFKNKNVGEYAKKLIKALGKPSGSGKYFLIWEDVGKKNYNIEIKNEYIAHNFPSKHHDFVYTSYKFPKLTPEIACKLIKVSGSIIPDLLSKKVSARCGSLTANSVTLSFVQDVIDGKIRPTKANYAKRMKEKNITHPRKFPAFIQKMK